MLLDREAEKQELDRLLAAIRGGLSGALVLRGEAGIGKTALLEYAIASAGDMHVAHVVGVESEMELGFAGLHQLLVPFLAGLERLPDPQRQALASAFGLIAGVAADVFLVGLAALTLLADAAADRPVLCVFDDAQWIDQASAGVVGFVARRLLADQIGVLFAVREPSTRPLAFEGLSELKVDGLAEGPARELLASVACGALDERVGERIVSETRGNPLALLELGVELTPAELSGGSRLPQPLPLGRRLEERFLARVRELPPDSQTLLLLASAQQLGDPALLWRAAEHLGLDRVVAVSPSIDPLLTLEPRVAFRHPLIRSAVYHGASLRTRREVHQALAAACDPERDADRRAWHLAEAATGPDERVAGELERSAERARDRGGWASGAAFLERSVELTPAVGDRTARSLAAAQAILMAGDPRRARVLLDTTETPDPLIGAQVRRMEGLIELALGEAAQAAPTLLEAAHAFEPLDARSARDTLLAALEAAVYAREFADEGGLLDVARAACAAPYPDSPASPSDLALDGFAIRVTEDYAAAVAPRRRAIAALRSNELGGATNLSLLDFGCVAATELMDDEAAFALALRLVRLARDQGALTTLPIALANLSSFGEVPGGRFDAAEAALAEAHEISAVTGNPGLIRPSVGEVFLLAWRGRAADTRTLAAAVSRQAVESGSGGQAIFAQNGLAVLELGLGNYPAALAAALAVYEDDPPWTGTLLLPALVEAAARSCEPEVALAALERLSERALASGTELALGLLARSRALLAGDVDAGPLYERAIAHLTCCRTATELASANLLYGEWLRRRRRRRDARERLRAAHAMFDAMGADAFAERARVELLGTGEHARKRKMEIKDELTPQEMQIARLAADGATNQEIAAQLFISSSTVAYHLRKVFRKLVISSRAQLAGAIRHEPQPNPPAELPAS